MRFAQVALLLVWICIAAWSFLFPHSLFGDSVALGRNLVERTFWELLQPLDHDQVAPIGFLWAMRSSLSLFGVNELSFRVVPFVAAVVLGTVLISMAWRIGGPLSAGVSLALMGLNIHVVYYAGIAKPYIVDAAATAVALYVWLLESGRRQAVFATIGGAFIVLMSFPAAIVLSAIGSLEIFSCLRRSDWPRTQAVSLIAAGWLAIFAGQYMLLRSQTDNDYLLEYWRARSGFTPRGSVTEVGWWIVGRVSHALNDPLGVASGIGGKSLAIIVLVWSAYHLRLREWRLVPSFVLTVLVTFGISAGEKYPFAERFLLFLVPFHILLVATATRHWGASLQSKGGILAVAALVGLTGWNTLAEVASRSTFFPDQNVSGVLSRLRDEIQPGDTVFVYQRYCSVMEFYLYQMDQRVPLDAEILGGSYARGTGDFARDIERIIEHAASSRVFLVFGHGGETDEQEYLQTLRRVGAVRGVMSDRGERIHVFSLALHRQ